VPPAAHFTNVRQSRYLANNGSGREFHKPDRCSAGLKETPHGLNKFKIGP
jgi:hypothetical protein